MFHNGYFFVPVGRVREAAPLFLIKFDLSSKLPVPNDLCFVVQ